MLRNLHIQYFKGLTDVKLSDCGPINALVGKNNSGKSSVLHAIDMAGLAISTGSWNQFQPKLAIKDMFSRAGSFMIALDYSDGLTMTVGSNAQNESPSFEPKVTEGHRFRSLLIMPDPEMGMLRRRHVTPASVMTAVENRQYVNINGLDILYAFRYYSQRRQRGFQPETYEQLIADIREFFPDIEDLEADRTDEDVATLTYQEYGRKLDILYSGTGLKQFLDTVVKITLSQARIVLIDEPEAGLHPDLQRKFIDFMKQLAEQKDLQFYIASHSPVFLSHRDVTVYRITNKKGHRDVVRTENDALHTVWADMGIRPSDLLQNDIVVMVEGQKDVIIFDHIINSLYQRELDGVSVGIIQYGGSSADGIIAGHINVENITSAQGYVLWIRDRDAKPGDPPPTNASKFANAIHKANQKCHILGQREIEWYLPESLYVEAQQGNSDCEATIKAVLAGNQEEKFRNAAKGCTVPQGKTLRLSMQKHVSRGDLNDELKRLVEDTLIPWRNKIVG